MSWTRRLRNEEGSVLVVGAIVVLVLVFLGAVVIQVGTWFQDRRHLQVRADAGALAGAQLFNECFDSGAFSQPKAKADIETAASEYAGFSSYAGQQLPVKYNDTFNSGTTGILFQSQTYPGGGGGGPDDTNTANECDPGNLALDVKLTRDVKGFFAFSPLGHVHAHARVQLKEVQSVVPTFPLAVPEIVPGAVAVTFVNEDTAQELAGCSGSGTITVGGAQQPWGLVSGTTCTFRLVDVTNANTPGSDPFNLGPWCLPQTIGGSFGCASLASVVLPSFAAGDTAVAKHIGMRVGIGDPTAVQSCLGGGNGNTWQCFNTSTSHGVVMIDEVKPASAQTATPKLLGVWPTTCSGSPFVGSDTAPVPCGATVTAKIDFGSTNLNSVTVKAVLTQSGGTPQTITLAYDSGTGLWSAPLSSASVSVNPASGGSEYTIDLCWKASGGGGGGSPGNCPGGYSGWAGIQRVVGATNTDDGPLDSISLTDPANPPNGPYSYVGGGARTLGTSVLLKAPFNKLTILRQSHSGSATAFIECRWKTPPNPSTGQLGVVDSGQNALSTSMQSGCQVPYQVNAATSCSPDPLSDPDKSDTPDCTQNKPCTACGNTITTALDARFGCANGTAQHPNLWPDYSEPGDPRAVTLVTTDFAAFDDNGNSQYPVTGFGAFYIAGVSGNACGDKWPTDANGNYILGPPPNPNSGTIWGYFIKYSNNDGTPSGRACKLNSLQNCVAVLTR